MKEILRFLGYTAATLVMIFILIGVAKSGVSDEALAYSAIFMVVIVPLIIGMWMVNREKRNTTPQ